ncbi:MAG: type I restriction endonuclease subunit R, partial [Victivallales bacterium]|nr:type I restriction endonuclease subunit R [Victivallales bacterium]
QRFDANYSKEYAIDEEMLKAFLEATQGDTVNRSRIFTDELEHKSFLVRLRNEITTRGVVDVLRHGLAHKSYNFTLYYPTPIAGNPKAKEQFAANRWCVTRQVYFSGNSNDSVDMVLSLNGLPIITMELKNTLSGEHVREAITQYKDTRSSKELLFMPKRCAVHFAVDDNEVYMCSALADGKSWFLPFNKGHNDGAGNPPCENGLRTSYLWNEILTIPRLADILENYAQVIKEKDQDTGKVEERVIWPRWHQLEAVRALLAATIANQECGQRYLIQHSAGSGKSNSITWLAFQLSQLKNADGINTRFKSVLVITDRRNLDSQIRDNIRAFCNNKSMVAWADDSEALKTALTGGKSIIVSTVCKFPFILQAIGRELKAEKFCVIIDEAHSSQSGNMASALNQVMGGFGLKDVKIEDNEDGLNELLYYIIDGRKLAANANFYAFTATPKDKTLEMFGVRKGVNAEGKPVFAPFHLYTMRQAIEEGFILDVVSHYTPYQSYYRILKSTESNPVFDNDSAQRKLRAWVESRPETVDAKTKIMVEHFHACVASRIKGQARCMIVTEGIDRAIDSFFAVKKLLAERHSPYKAIVAFSGTHNYHGHSYDEASLNGFPSSKIEKTFRNGDYRFLIVADKFQTGYDEKLLHTMYVDKPLSDI